MSIVRVLWNWRHGKRRATDRRCKRVPVPLYTTAKSLILKSSRIKRMLGLLLPLYWREPVSIRVYTYVYRQVYIYLHVDKFVVHFVVEDSQERGHPNLK